MQKYTFPSLVMLIAIALLCLYMILPNAGLFGRPIEVRAGLDIQGGLRVLMAAEEGFNPSTEQMNEVRRIIDRRVNGLGVAEAVVQVAGSNRIIVELPGVQDPQRAIDAVQETALLEFVDFSAVGGCTAPMPVAGQYVLTDRQIQIRNASTGATNTPTPEATPAATEAAATATAESTAAAEPASEATAETTAAPTMEPTAETTAEATEAAATTEPTAEATAATEPTAAATETAAEPTAEPTAAATSEATPEATPTPEDNTPGTRSNPLPNPCTGQPFNTVMTGAALKSANQTVAQQGSVNYAVEFSLDTGNAEAQNFATHTGANIGQPLAIVLDGEVISAPTIQAKLDDGGIIEGSFSLEEATTLAIQLRSGALPVALRIESLEQVGASLGAESVESSVRAGVVGLIAVFLFLILYYRVGGLAAALALILFGMMNFALYKYIPVTLTLSAITGFLISIGSAIDGNILIFERIKEEIRAGRPLARAVELGFSRAWTSIRDSNISTILIALILYFFGGQFGASAVRGFAVTLIMGLILNLFTAVVVTRVFLNVTLGLLGERARNMNLFGH